jgi:signal peptidase I
MALLLLAFLAPGAGLIAIGKVKQGSCLLTLFILAIIIFGSTDAIYELASISSYLGGLCLFVVLIIIFTARSSFEPSVSLKYVKQSVLSIFAFWLVLIPLIYFKSFAIGIEIYRVHANSMTPNLFPGDFIIAHTRFDQNGINKGDILFFNHPTLQDTQLVKRVVAKGGEVVEFSNQSYKVHSETAKQLDPLRSQITLLKSDELFLIGDNIKYSKDSRHFGPIHKHATMAKAVWLYRDGHFSLISN